MRLVKTGAIALALACSTIIGAGAAHADQKIEVTAKLLDCSVRSRVDLGVLAIVGPNGTVTVSDDVYTRLRAAGCFL
ncbi:hypothetical protein AB4305_14195 [Nocardia sp. 2YAB30]|uniref:hypothetical protein n=1 Tax=unclassified Nocardia TaxID=2637762 RepID=UPI003F96B084